MESSGSIDSYCHGNQNVVSSNNFRPIEEMDESALRIELSALEVEHQDLLSQIKKKDNEITRLTAIAVRVQQSVEVEEEKITNDLLRRLHNASIAKKEAQKACKIEKNEISNIMSRVAQIQAQLVEVEKEIETEQELILNKLQRQLLDVCAKKRDIKKRLVAERGEYLQLLYQRVAQSSTVCQKPSVMEMCPFPPNTSVKRASTPLSVTMAVDERSHTMLSSSTPATPFSRNKSPYFTSSIGRNSVSSIARCSPFNVLHCSDTPSLTPMQRNLNVHNRSYSNSNINEEDEDSVNLRINDSVRRSRHVMNLAAPSPENSLSVASMEAQVNNLIAANNDLEEKLREEEIITEQLTTMLLRTQQEANAERDRLTQAQTNLARTEEELAIASSRQGAISSGVNRGLVCDRDINDFVRDTHRNNILGNENRSKNKLHALFHNAPENNQLVIDLSSNADYNIKSKADSSEESLSLSRGSFKTSNDNDNLVDNTTIKASNPGVITNNDSTGSASSSERSSAIMTQRELSTDKSFSSEKYDFHF